MWRETGGATSHDGRLDVKEDGVNILSPIGDDIYDCVVNEDAGYDCDVESREGRVATSDDVTDAKIVWRVTSLYSIAFDEEEACSAAGLLRETDREEDDGMIAPDDSG